MQISIVSPREVLVKSESMSKLPIDNEGSYKSLQQKEMSNFVLVLIKGSNVRTKT